MEGIDAFHKQTHLKVCTLQSSILHVQPPMFPQFFRCLSIPVNWCQLYLANAYSNTCNGLTLTLLYAYFSQEPLGKVARLTRSAPSRQTYRTNAGIVCHFFGYFASPVESEYIAGNGSVGLGGAFPATVAVVISYSLLLGSTRRWGSRDDADVSPSVCLSVGWSGQGKEGH